MDKGVFVLGASGMVGRELVKELLLRTEFGKVVIITRRTLEGDIYKDTEQRLVDFDKIEEHNEAFQGLDKGFCCLGTTRSQAGAAGFFKVDHDYVVNSAKVAKSNGCKHFTVVSSAGASATSTFLYPSTKGKMEESLKNIGFDRLSIFRPAFLLCKRENPRLTETLATVAMAPLTYFFPTRSCVETSCVARAMLNNASQAPLSGQVETFFNPDICSLGQK